MEFHRGKAGATYLPPGGRLLILIGRLNPDCHLKDEALRHLQICLDKQATYSQ